ncbi:hypothetical protein [Streptomyces justiciae]|uniref:hypothetical protein n=1 Tax=Streptomyces justiciae TaxID=2780140 RepID=UPI0021193176|nr:hypothetical protein [Streptomyces justiciae]MCW8376740.1 hypothetical protein [Streptomyces justiciae]
MFRRSAVAVAAVGVLALAGCGADDSGGAAPEPTVTSGAPAPEVTADATTPEVTADATTPTPAPTTDPTQKLASLSISGGFAGVSQQVVLRGDGTVHARDNGRSATRHLGAAEFRELRTLLGDPALDEVPDFTVNTGAADLFQYQLRFDGRTVMTDRSASHPAVDRLIDALSAFLPKG